MQKLLSLLLAASLLPWTMFAQEGPEGPPPPPPQEEAQSSYTFRTTSDLVLVDVVARDKSGNLVRDLKQSDFSIVEDGKPQHLMSFDIERPEGESQTNVAQGAGNGPSQVTVQEAVKNAPILTGDSVKAEAVRDRRLIILFFDLSAMEPEEVDRAVKSATDYVNKQMSPADLVSVITLGNSMTVTQDFTNDHAALKKALTAINGEEGQGFEQGLTGSSDGTADTGAQYTPDDTEYNLFNTDRRLMAINTLAKSLSKLPQKKSVLYFAGGMQRTGVENQSELRAAINASVRSNLSLYTVDSRGLEALPPGGQAQSASVRGTSAYSGASVQSDLDSNFSSQETLVTLASDTGGKAFLDTNDFSGAFKKVQQDTSLYYLIGYRSTNKAMDGHYRHIKILVNRKDIKLEYRTGYYGPRDFMHFTKEDREKQLDDEIASDLPVTDLPVYVDTAYFRMRGNDYFVPTSIVVPGSSVPFKSSSDKDKATLDVIGLVREASSKIPIANIRETVKLCRRDRSDGEAQERAVQHSVPAVARQISPEVRGPGKRNWEDWLIRERLRHTGFEEVAAEDEFSGSGNAVRITRQAQAESSDSRWQGVDSEPLACLHRRSATNDLLRSLRSGEGEGLPTRSPKTKTFTY